MRRKYYFLFIILFYTISFYAYRPWEKHIVFGGDGWGYYAYLPALFINHDIVDLKKTFAKSIEYGHLQNPYSNNPLGTDVPHHIGGGKQIIKYTSGVAIMMSPFFMLAHAMAGWLDYPQDGFSLPYMLLVNMGVLFYVIVGLWILALFLRKLFSKNITALCVLTVALATNLYFFTVYNCPMSHGYLFFWYSCLLYATHLWHERPNYKYAFLIGLSCGFILLIRPSDGIVLLLPILYGVSTYKHFKGKFYLAKKHIVQFGLTVFAFFLPIIPQLIYWKSISGEWFFYSYEGKTLNFLNPHILGGFFSYTNGWLVYTPVMALALIGFIFLWKNKNWRLPIILFFILHVYIIYSWWCWYYINGIGSRPMVQTYPVLAIPLGYTFVYLYKRSWTKGLLLVLLSFFSVLNGFQTWQLSKGILWSSSASKGYFWEVFGATKITQEAVIAFDTYRRQPNANNLKFVKQLYFNDFEDSLNVNYSRRFSKNGNYGFAMEGNVMESPEFSTSLEESGLRPGDWLKCSAWCRSEKKEADWYRMNKIVVSFGDGKKVYRHVRMRIENKIGKKKPSLWNGKVHQWGDLSFFIRVPYKAKQKDFVKAFVERYHLDLPVYIDDFKVELYREK